MSETMRMYGVIGDSIVDGPGFRTAVFVQGCPHHCEGCHNPDSHDFAGGTEMTLDEIEQRFSGNPLLDGITLSGGEPFCQAAGCAELARRAHRKGLNVWCFTGFLYEALLKKAEQEPDVKALLGEIDVLVDGPFVLSQRSLDLLYKGSKNQRILDMQKTRQSAAPVLWQPPQW